MLSDVLGVCVIFASAFGVILMVGVGMHHFDRRFSWSDNPHDSTGLLIAYCCAYPFGALLIIIACLAVAVG